MYCAVGHGDDVRAVRAFNQDLHSAIRQLKHLQYVATLPIVIQIVGMRIVLRRAISCAINRMCLPASCDIERLDRFRATDNSGITMWGILRHRVASNARDEIPVVGGFSAMAKP
jgi:hypothetical protein